MTDEAFARAARTYGDTIYRVAYHALSSPQPFLHLCLLNTEDICIRLLKKV